MNEYPEISSHLIRKRKYFSNPILPAAHRLKKSGGGTVSQVPVAAQDEAFNIFFNTMQFFNLKLKLFQGLADVLWNDYREKIKELGEKVNVFS